jgi:hypothetical protein
MTTRRIYLAKVASETEEHSEISGDECAFPAPPPSTGRRARRRYSHELLALGERREDDVAKFDGAMVAL